MDGFTMLAFLGASSALAYNLYQGHVALSTPFAPTDRTNYPAMAMVPWKSNQILPMESAKTVAAITPLQTPADGVATRWQILLMNRTIVYVTASPQQIGQKFKLSSSPLAGFNPPNINFEANTTRPIPFRASGAGDEVTLMGHQGPPPTTRQQTTVF